MMAPLEYRWRADGEEHAFRLAHVPGTAGRPMPFGWGPERPPIELHDFYIGTTAVTQALWTHVMGANPSKRHGARLPVENVSWNHITGRLGWRIAGRRTKFLKTHSHDVATKAPNQLGLYDMSGNIWEWCQDTCVDFPDVPRDGTPATSGDGDRRLRGGCHTNWDLHCTVYWRYGITPEAHDSCLGVRVVLADEVGRRPPGA